MNNIESIKGKVNAVNAPVFITELIMSISTLQGVSASDVATRILQPYATGNLTTEDRRAIGEEFFKDFNCLDIEDYTSFLKEKSLTLQC